MVNKTLLLIVISLLVTACNLIPKKQGQVLEGPLYKEYYENGKIKSICQTEGKKRDGICNTYYQNGKLKSTAHYRLNKFHGMYTSYYENGNVKSEIPYNDHKKDGEAKFYYASGSVKIIEHYVDGELNGVKQKFYPNGQAQMENNYQDGYPSVSLKEWDLDGNPITESPEIIVKAKDNITLSNTYTLTFKLSNNSQRVKYFLGNITDEGYLPYYMESIDSKRGVGTIVFPVFRGTMVMEKMNIIAKWKTPLGNTKVLTHTYNLAIKY